MNAELSTFVERLALAAGDLGVPMTAGRILGTLLVCSPPHRTAGQLVDELGASTGAVSQNLRLLEDWGLVEAAPIPGARARHVRLRSGAWAALMEDRLARVRTFHRIAEEGLALVEGGTDEGTGDLRLREMAEYYGFMARELPALLERFRARRASMTLGSGSPPSPTGPGSADRSSPPPKS